MIISVKTQKCIITYQLYFLNYSVFLMPLNLDKAVLETSAAIYNFMLNGLLDISVLNKYLKSISSALFITKNLFHKYNSTKIVMYQIFAYMGKWDKWQEKPGTETRKKQRSLSYRKD